MCVFDVVLVLCVSVFRFVCLSAVSKYSKYPSAAADLVFWLANEQSQKLRFQLQGTTHTQNTQNQKQNNTHSTKKQHRVPLLL